MPKVPSDPPDDPGSLQAWARALAEASPDERAAALADLPDPGDDPWVEVLARLFPGAADRPPADASAAALVAALGQAGLAPDEARELLGDVFSDPGLQGGWSDWGAVADRREVRERALVLAEAHRVAPDQVDFLLFALRASDPAVYHPAAVAVGRHALTSPEVRDRLAGYARERGLDLDEPLALDGGRTRRRLLLVQAGARAAGLGREAEGDLLPQPLPLPADLPDDPGDPLPEAPADVVALVRAVTTLLEAGDPDDRLARGADALLAAVPDLPERTLSRWVVEAWSDLLVESPDPDPARDPARRLLLRLTQVPDPRIGSLAEPLRDLLRLDAALAVLPRVPAARAEALLSEAREAASRDLRPLVLSRAATWAARHGGANPDWVDDAVDRLDHGDADLLEAAALVSLRSPGAEGFRVLEALAEALRVGPSWPGRSPRDRGVLALLALDAVRSGDPPPDRARSLLADLGLLPEAAGPGDSLLGLLLEGLLAREPEGAEAVLDARFLHEAASARLLLAVLSPDARVPPEAVADALEHIVRVRLHADPAFEPVAFLARTAVRRPDPAVYRALAEVSADRTYARPDGRSFPLDGVAGILARDAAEARTPPDAWAGAPAGVPPSLGPARDRLRDRLASLRDPGLPDEAVQGLVDAVGGGPPGTAPPADTARGLLRTLHDREGPLLAAGRPAWAPGSRTALEDALGDALRRVEDRVPDLRPERLEALGGGADPAAEVADALADVRALAVPHLPGPEADLLEAAAGAVEERLAAWSRGVDDLREAWGPDDGVAGADALLEAVDAGWAPPERRPILATALRSLRGAADDPHRLLAWAAATDVPSTWTADERATWRAWRRDLWGSCLEGALAREDAPRVRALLSDPAHQAARSHPDNRDLLRRARTWGYERYRVGPAVAVERSRDEAGPVGAAARAVQGYLGHFSPVWLALVVGAILMLDFGDAWREMAAAGDVTGVAVTAVLGVGGAFAYVLADLDRRTRPGGGDAGGVLPEAGGNPSASGGGADGPSSPGSARRLSLAAVGRAGVFVGLCLAWALAVTAGLWWLLSGTDEVVHGPGAPLHVAVWAGFALFVGIFFGLVAKET